MKYVEKLKNRGFWVGLLTAVAGFVGGSMTAPDFFIALVHLFGG